MYSSDLYRRHRDLQPTILDDRKYSSFNYSSSGYTSGHTRDRTSTLLKKSNYSKYGSSILPSRHTYDGYSSSGSFLRSPAYQTASTSSWRDEVKADVVRPAMRSRGSSVSRDINTSRRGREHSVPRLRQATEYPDLGPRRIRPASPARAVRAAVPEFHTIQSTYDSKRTSRRGEKASTRTTVDHTLPTIEVDRTIHKPDDPLPDISVYTPSFGQDRTRDYDVESPTKSSAGSRRNEVFQSKEKVSSSSSSGNSSRETPDQNAGLVGLKNIGNTCFMNSILQCLSNTRPLRDYCIAKKYEKDINETSSPMKGRLVEAFSEIIWQLWHPSSSRSVVSTSSFKREIETFSRRFSGYEQQDSQEFLRFLIEGLHEDVNKVARKPKDSMPNFDSLSDDSKARKSWDFYLSKDRSYIVDLFMGQLKSSLTCVECGHVSTTFDPFWDLSLSIPKSSYRLDGVDVQQCLENFTKEEVLEGDERPNCGKCKARRRMTKKFTIYRFPRILVIHLKRFSEGRYRQKIQTRVNFPHRLEISSPTSMLRECFDLYAVSNHSGQCYGGHYTAYCKKPETEKWHSFNDSMVLAMSQSSVETKEAYVLFYESTPTRSRSHL